MATRYDILTSREYTTRDGEVKRAYTKIGTMFPLERGGFSLSFDALPIPSMRDGKVEVRAVAFEPKERDEAPKTSGNARANAKRDDDLDDSIPF